MLSLSLLYMNSHHYQDFRCICVLRTLFESRNQRIVFQEGERCGALMGLIGKLIFSDFEIINTGHTNCVTRYFWGGMSTLKNDQK